ncbi:MAG: hypothetical protein V1862_02510, partial [Methanobacteriota archaeon]
IFKISILCLILISCALIATMVSAEGDNVINPVSSDSGGVITPVSVGEASVMNPVSSDSGGVISPVSTDGSSALNQIQSGEVSVLSETEAALMQGQASQVYRVTLNCQGIVRLTSSYGSRYNLYAKKNTEYGSCPSASSILSTHDKVAYGYSGSAVITLDPGVWCLMVFGYSGSGTYSLRVTTNCQQPTPTFTPTPYPTWTPYPTQTSTPCGVYKTDTRQGYLNQGQAAVYGYSIPSDTRSQIEWSMTASGSSTGGDVPIIAASVGDAPAASSSSSGSPTFDLYIFKDCNPRNSRCNTNYYSYGPNSHVSITSPSTGSVYYAMIYARSGSGTFTMNMKSYKCTGGDTPVIPMSVSAESAGDSSSGSEVTAPTAEFILSDGAN